MSDSRRPANEKKISAANKLDIELGSALDSIGNSIASIDETFSKPFITMAEYESLNVAGLSGFLRSFTGPKISPDDQTEIAASKAELMGAGSDHERYNKAMSQRKQIYDKVTAKENVSDALKQYADKLDSLIQVADSRVLTAKYHARPKK